MPFDSTPQETVVYTGAAKLIDDALKLLGPNGEHWTIGAFKRDDRYCVLGALRYADGWHRATRTPYFRAAYSAIEAATGHRDIADWNDHQSGGYFHHIRIALIKARAIAATQK